MPITFTIKLKPSVYRREVSVDYVNAVCSKVTNALDTWPIIKKYPTRKTFEMEHSFDSSSIKFKIPFLTYTGS